jgi:hypothetical protein
MDINVEKVWTDQQNVYLLTQDGKVYHEAFDNYKKLKNATLQQRNDFYCSNVGIHWNGIDEDLSYKGFILNNTKTTPHGAEIPGQARG